MKINSAREFIRNKKVLFLLFGTFFFMSSLSVSYSVVPVYLLHQHATLANVGISTAIYSLAAILFMIFLGPLADKKGRKFALLVSSFSFMVSWVLIWFAPTFELHLVARIIQAIGLALYMPTGSSVVNDIAAPKVIGSCMGIYRGFLGFGFAVGPALSFLLIKINFEIMFIVNILFALIAFILLSFISETSKIGKVRKKNSLLKDYRELLTNGKLVRYYLLVITITCGHGIIMANSAIFLSGIKGIIPPGVFLFCIFTLGTLASLVGGRLIDKLGIKKVIIPAVLFTLTGFFLMSLVEGAGNKVIFLAIIAIGLGTNSSIISSITGIGRATRNELKATSFSIEECSYNGGIALGNFLFGFLAAGLGFSLSFLIIGMLMTISYSLIFISYYISNRKNKSLTIISDDNTIN